MPHRVAGGALPADGKYDSGEFCRMANCISRPHSRWHKQEGPPTATMRGPEQKLRAITKTRKTFS